MPSISKKLSSWAREVPLSEHFAFRNRINISTVIYAPQRGLTRQLLKKMEVHFYG